MSRITLRLFLILCLCGAGALGPVLAWSDPVPPSGPAVDAAESTPSSAAGDAGADVNTRADVNADANTGTSDASAPPQASGTGLKPPPSLTEPDDDDDIDDADKRVAAPPVADKSLASVHRNDNNKPRLGRELGAGVASWYGPRFYGRRTASGERFDRDALTAAHKTLPLGALVLVSNPRTGKQVVVRINDRGPYLGNRILDLSEAAARALGLKARGSDWVVMNEVLPPRATDTSSTAATTALPSTSSNPLAFPPAANDSAVPPPPTAPTSRIKEDDDVANLHEPLTARGF